MVRAEMKSQKTFEALREKWGNDFEANFNAAELGLKRILSGADGEALSRLDKVFGDPVESMDVLRSIGLEGRTTGLNPPPIF